MSRIWMEDDEDRGFELCNTLLKELKLAVNRLHPELSDIESELVAYKIYVYDAYYMDRNMCENFDFFMNYENLIRWVQDKKEDWTIGNECVMYKDKKI